MQSECKSVAAARSADAFRIANYSLAAIKFWPGRVAVN